MTAATLRALAARCMEAALKPGTGGTKLDADIALATGWQKYPYEQAWFRLDNFELPRPFPPAFTADLNAAMSLYMHKPDMISSCPRKVAADALQQRAEILEQGHQSR